MSQHPQRSLLPIGRRTRHEISLDPGNLYYSGNTTVYMMPTSREHLSIDCEEGDRSEQGNGNGEEDGMKRRIR